jgi:hypothetical protein
MLFQSHRQQVILLFLLAFLCLVVGMGNAPLFLEEPRRGLVAMEMLYSGDYFHTTVHGAPYYNKPPLFNWIVAAGFRLFGYHEWVLRSITVVAHLLTGLLIYAAGRKYLSAKIALTSAGLYLAGADILFYFSLLGEIDVFFSLLIVAGWFSYFHYGEQQKPGRAFAGLYLFMAFAFLTKGLPAILFLGFTLLVWQGYKKDWRGLFTWQHFAAIGLFCGVVGSYLFPFLVKGDFDTLLQTLWSQSVERAAAETNLWKRILSFFTFPVSLFKDILPGSLLLLLLFGGVLKKVFAQNRLIAFCCLVFAANIWIYWISPDSKSRYIYMFHGLLLLPAVWGFYQQQPATTLRKIVEGFFRVMPWVITVLLAAALFLLPFFLKTEGVWWTLPVGLCIALLFLVVSKKAGWSPVYLTVLMLILLRGPYGYITGMERAQHSQASKDKAVAIEMAKMAGDQRIFLADSTRISYTISYYLQRDLGKIVPFTFNKKKGDLVIMPDSLLTGNLEVKKTFLYQDTPFSLVKVKE